MPLSRLASSTETPGTISTTRPAGVGQADDAAPALPMPAQDACREHRDERAQETEAHPDDQRADEREIRRRGVRMRGLERGHPSRILGHGEDLAAGFGVTEIAKVGISSAKANSNGCHRSYHGLSRSQNLSPMMA